MKFGVIFFKRKTRKKFQRFSSSRAPKLADLPVQLTNQDKLLDNLKANEAIELIFMLNICVSIQK